MVVVGLSIKEMLFMLLAHFRILKMSYNPAGYGYGAPLAGYPSMQPPSGYPPAPQPFPNAGFPGPSDQHYSPPSGVSAVFFLLFQLGKFRLRYFTVAFLMSSNLAAS